MKKLLSIAIMLLALVSARADVFTENINNLNVAIPDANPAGVLLSTNLTDIPAGWVMSSVTVNLNVTNGYNGDLYAYLVAPDGTLVTLMNEPGVGVDGFGASGDGMNITLQDGTSDHGPIQNETGYLRLTGSYNPTMALTNFNNKIAHGTWKLFVADLSVGGGISVLKGWGMTIVADRQVPNVVLNRHTGTGSSSTYGDSLSFDVSVSGATPSGTVTLKDGGIGGLTLGTGTLSGGICTITPTLNSLTADTHTNIVAVYGGDSVFAPANSTALSAQTVAQKSLVITGVTAGDKIYDATTSVSINTASAALSGLVSGDSGNVTLDSTGAFASFGDKNVAAGKSVTTTGFIISGSASANYLLVQPGLTASISTKNLSVAGNLSVPSSKVYDGNTVATVSGSAGLQTAETAGTGSTADGKPYSGDVVSLIGAVTQANYDSKDVNATHVTFVTGSLALTGTDNGNYSFNSLIQQAASITPLPVILTGNRNYDATTNAFAAILSVANKVGSDPVSVASGTGGLAGKDAGTQSLTSFGTLALGSNLDGDYTLSGASGSVLITPAPASVTANDATKVYGTANPTFTATVVGALNSDTINYSLSSDATQYSSVGVSNILVSLGSNPNYTVATTNGLLTITPAAVSVTANDATKVYGTANPTFTATVVGALNSDTINYTLSSDASQYSSVGVSNILVNVGSNPNYTVATTNGLLTITPAAVSVTANDATKVYGTANPTFTATVVGALNSDTINYSLSSDATQYSSVGVSNILVSLGSNPNYTVATTNGLLTITPAAVSVTANDATKVYGTANPTFTATVVGALNSDTINYSLSSDATQYSSVGVSNILVNVGSNPNYTVATTNGLLTITPASTTIVAGSSANPSGFTDSIYFTASLPADAAGSVVFKTNGVAFDTASLSGGSANSVTTTALARGNTTITAEYAGSGNYVGSTNSFVQIVTNHPPVASVMLVTRTAGLSLKIALSDLATNWSDVDGDAVTLASLNLTTTNGVTLVQTNGWIYYTNAPNVADQISYTVSDGHGGTNTGYVNITVSFALVTGQTTGITVPDGNTAVVSFAGIPGYTYQVQRSTNLTDWVTISTTNAPTGGLFNYTDTFGDLGGNVPTSAYYRLGWTPSP